VQFECKVNQIIPWELKKAERNLILCGSAIHIDEAVLDTNGSIDQHKIDLVSRLGGSWYSRSNQGLFEVPKPLRLSE
jgi:hypothetical protein